MAKIVFLQEQWVQYLGVMYLSALLKKHEHNCELFIENNVDKIIKKLYKIQPDIIAFPTTTGMHQWVLYAAKEIKKKIKTLIVLGGPHPTYFSQIIKNDGIDIICRGEGEYALLELTNAINKKNEIKNIANLWIKEKGIIYKNEVRSLIANLDDLPFADRDLYSKYLIFHTESTKMFITTRGCPYNCFFCYNEKLKELYHNKGIYLRRRSIENIIEEIKLVKSKYNLKTVYFIDDTFIYDKSWCFKFLETYRKEIGLPFICPGTADKLTDEELVKELKNSMCYSVFLE